MAFGAIACSSNANLDGGTGGQGTNTSAGTGASGAPASGGSLGSAGESGGGAANGGQLGGATNAGGSAGTGVGTGGVDATGGSSPGSGGDVAGGGANGGAGGTSAGAGGTSAGTGGANAGAGTAGSGGGDSGGEGGTSGNGGAGASGAGGGSGDPTSFQPCPTNGDPCKILPLGDSITLGIGSSDNAGYRSQLFKLAVAANQKLTFTGSQSGGPNEVSGKPFPKNHEGHSGWTIDPGHSKYGSGGISSLIPNPALSTQPNIILLMIGTNDITSTDSPGMTANRLEGFLDKLVQAAPDALVVVAKITPVSYNSPDLDNYNAKIPAIVEARAAKGHHVVTVDMSKMPRSGLAQDGVHPNDQGYAFMADVWYEAIKDYLPN